MLDKQIKNKLYNIFPRYITDELLLSLDSYSLFLERLSINPLLSVS